MPRDIQFSVYFPPFRAGLPLDRWFEEMDPFLAVQSILPQGLALAYQHVEFVDDALLEESA